MGHNITKPEERGFLKNEEEDEPRYTVGLLLGEGAYGEVRKGTDLLTKQPVAIKFV